MVANSKWSMSYRCSKVKTASAIARLNRPHIQDFVDTNDDARERVIDE